MGSPAPFLIWLLCIGITAIMIGYFIRDLEKEGFADTPSDSGSLKRQPPIIITTCPKGSVSYITSTGNTNCCEGDLVNNVCNGNIMCSLSPSIPGGLQSCADWVRKEWTNRSVKFCSQSLPYYFGTLVRTPGTEGCSASLCSSDGSVPEDPNQPRCKIYGNMADELAMVDSCFNAVAKDAITCPQADAKKSLISYGKSTPAILTCNYVPKDDSTNGMPTTCMDAERSIQYIQSLTTMSPEQKGATINTINSKKDPKYCNYVGSSGKWMISGDSVQSTGVTKIITPVPYGPYKSQTLLLAQSGNNIISVYIDKNGNVLNGRTGKSIDAKLTDYNIVTFDDYLKMIETLNKGRRSSREKDVNNMRATKM